MRHDVSSAIQKEFIQPDPKGDIKEVLIAELADKICSTWSTVLLIHHFEYRLQSLRCVIQ